MKLVERYLHRISFWLPKQGRSDILQELRGAIQERIEVEEERKGRPLRDEEVEQALQSFGNPMLVVARYVRQPPVISGGLAFFFWRVLAIVLISTLLIQLTVVLVEARRASTLLVGISSGLDRVFVPLLLGFACVTVSFMIFERRYGQS